MIANLDRIPRAARPILLALGGLALAASSAPAQYFGPGGFGAGYGYGGFGYGVAAGNPAAGYGYSFMPGYVGSGGAGVGYPGSAAGTPYFSFGLSPLAVENAVFERTVLGRTSPVSRPAAGQRAAARPIRPGAGRHRHVREPLTGGPGRLAVGDELGDLAVEPLVVLDQPHMPGGRERAEAGPRHILGDELAGLGLGRGVLVAHEHQGRHADPRQGRRGVVGDHAEHPPGQDIRPSQRHEVGAEVELAARLVPENEVECVDLCADPLK